jgi:multiple sugar transport system permease protein
MTDPTFTRHRRGARVGRNVRRWSGRLIVVYPFLLVVSALLLYPVAWMIYSSVKSNTDVLANPFSLPKGIDFSNFHAVFSEDGMGTWFTNSAVIAVVSTVALVALSAPAAYGFASFAFKGKEAIFALVLVGLMVPPQALVISGFKWLGILHLLDSYWGLILTYCGWSSFGILVLRNFFQSVPRELRDAARIDGANHWQIFTRIMLPLARPSLATVTIFNFLWVWNDFIYPLVFVQSESHYTIPVGILQFQGRAGIQWGSLMAALTVATAVPLLVYIVFQRQFVRGLLEGAIKG